MPRYLLAIQQYQLFKKKVFEGLSFPPSGMPDDARSIQPGTKPFLRRPTIRTGITGCPK
jgi:hypothetical protein